MRRADRQASGKIGFVEGVWHEEALRLRELSSPPGANLGRLAVAAEHDTSDSRRGWLNRGIANLMVLTTVGRGHYDRLRTEANQRKMSFDQHYGFATARAEKKIANRMRVGFTGLDRDRIVKSQVRTLKDEVTIAINGVNGEGTITRHDGTEYRVTPTGVGYDDGNGVNLRDHAVDITYPGQEAPIALDQLPPTLAAAEALALTEFLKIAGPTPGHALLDPITDR